MSAAKSLARAYPGVYSVRIEVCAPSGRSLALDGAVDEPTAERTLALLTEISKAPPVKSEPRTAKGRRQR